MAVQDILTSPHFWVMLIGIVLLALAIIVVVVHKPKQWFLLHRMFAVTGIILTIIGLFVLSGLNLLILHVIIGFIVIIWLIMEVIGGIVATKKKDPTMRKVHIWLGRIVFLVALIVFIFGILTFL